MVDMVSDCFVVAIATIYVLPFLSSPQLEEELQIPPTSIMQSESTNTQSQQPIGEDKANNSDSIDEQWQKESGTVSS
jgi:hypothetical protein